MHAAESKISKKIIIVIVVLGAFLLSIFAFGLWRWRAKLKGEILTKPYTSSHQYNILSQ